jgi:hypothetical protein
VGVQTQRRREPADAATDDEHTARSEVGYRSHSDTHAMDPLDRAPSHAPAG